jgi:hypothetical protein
MFPQGIILTRSFCLRLTSAKGQKQECFKLAANYIFISTMQINAPTAPNRIKQVQYNSTKPIVQ